MSDELRQDDSQPVTEAWLLKRGAHSNEYGWTLDAHPSGKGNAIHFVRKTMKPILYQPDGESFGIDRLITRGECRQLAALLGIELKENQ